MAIKPVISPHQDPAGPPGLVVRAPSGAPYNVELRHQLARINFYIQHNGGFPEELVKLQEEMSLCWAPMQEIDKELEAAGKFKSDFNGDPFGTAVNFLQYRLHETSQIAAAIRSAAIAFNHMVARGRSRDLEISISPSPSGIGIGITVYCRAVVAEVPTPLPPEEEDPCNE